MSQDDFMGTGIAVSRSAVVAGARYEDEVSLFFSPELYRHAQEGDVEGVARALDAGADPNGRVRRGGFAPIHTAAYNG